MILVYDTVQTSLNSTAQILSSNCLYLSSTGLSKLGEKLTEVDSSSAPEAVADLVSDVTGMFSGGDDATPNFSEYKDSIPD